MAKKENIKSNEIIESNKSKEFKEENINQNEKEIAEKKTKESKLLMFQEDKMIKTTKGFNTDLSFLLVFTRFSMHLVSFFMLH